MKTKLKFLDATALILFGFILFATGALAKASPTIGFIREPGNYELDNSGSRLEISKFANGRLSITTAWNTGGKISFRFGSPTNAQDWFVYVENPNMIWLCDGTRFEAFMHDPYGSGAGSVDANLFETCPKEVRDALPETVRKDAETNVGTNLVLSPLGEAQVGVGLRLDKKNDAKPKKILATIRASPAAKAGIKPGTLLLTIDGTPTEGLPFPDCNRLIRGSPGTSVTVEVLDPKLNQTNRFTLQRRKSISE